MKKVAEAEAKKGSSLLSLKNPPQVIEMYSGFEKVKFGNDPIYYVSHLRYWLMEYGITSAKEESNKVHKDISLPKKTKKILKVSVADIFGNYAFLFPEVKAEDLEGIVEALEQASHIFHDRHGKHGDEFHAMRLVKSPDNYKLLRDCLLALCMEVCLIPEREEVERMAEYFVLFAKVIEIFKSPAMQYFYRK